MTYGRYGRLPVHGQWAQDSPGTRIGQDLEKDLDLDLNMPDHRFAGAADMEDACGEYRRPLSFQLGLFGQPALEVHRERLELAAKMFA